MPGVLIDQGILRQSHDYYVLKQSMPYPLADNNAYLIESNDGWVVIDVGVDLPLTREVWITAFQEIGISPRQVSRIYISHCHPDHLGAARWLQQLTEAPVMMLDEEIQRAQEFIFLEGDFEQAYGQAVKSEFTAHRFPLALQTKLIKDWHLEVIPLFQKPEYIAPLKTTDLIELGGENFQIIAAPVHADGQMMFWSKKRQHLFCADLVASSAYLHFTDWPNSHLSNPLQNFFDLSENLREIENATVFPGHGPVFDELMPRLDVIKKRHFKLLKIIKDSINRPITAGELYIQAFPMSDDVYIHNHRIILGETIGYLMYLVNIGELELNELDGEQVFCPKR